MRSRGERGRSSRSCVVYSPAISIYNISIDRSHVARLPAVVVWWTCVSGIIGLMRVVWLSSTAISNSSSNHRRRNILKRHMARGLCWGRAHILLCLPSLGTRNRTRNICCSNTQWCRITAHLKTYIRKKKEQGREKRN